MKEPKSWNSQKIMDFVCPHNLDFRVVILRLEQSRQYSAKILYKEEIIDNVRANIDALFVASRAAEKLVEQMERKGYAGSILQ